MILHLVPDVWTSEPSVQSRWLDADCTAHVSILKMCTVYYAVLIRVPACAWKYRLWVLLDKYRAGLQLLPQVCEVCFVKNIKSRKSDQRMWYSPYIHTRFIKTNSGVNLSRKPGLDICCDLPQHLQGVPRTGTVLPVVFEFLHRILSVRTSILLASSLIKSSFIWNVTRSNSRVTWMAVFAQFCFM